MIVEGGPDVIGVGTAKDFHVAEHVAGPGGVLLFLAAARRIGRRHIAVDALDLGLRAVKAHHREQPMADHLAAHFLQGLADAQRLFRRAQRGGERGEILRREVPARRRGYRHANGSFKRRSGVPKF